MSGKIILIMSITGLLLAGGSFLPWNDLLADAKANPAKNQKKATEVSVVSVVKDSMTSTLDLTGSVEPFRVAQLASPAEGPVTKISAREGDQVKTGEILVTIGRTEGVDALIVSLQDELRKEEDNTSRTRQLVENGALPGEQLDQAKTVLGKVRAQLIKARETALDYTVAAPWNGVVSRLLVKDGAFVAPRAMLLEMYDPKSLVIRSAVSEKYCSEIAAEMPVTVTLDAYPKKTFQAKISRIYPYLDAHLRTRSIEITLDKSVGLLPGMFARVTVQTDLVPEALVIPVSALVPAPSGGKTVFIANNGTALKRSVQTGIEDKQRVQVIAGIDLDDKVIIAGNENLKDGDAIRIAGEKNSEGR